MRIIVQFLSILCLVASSVSQILAIDFGTEFIKAALVNTGSGKAFTIVETSKSERKFLNSIGFYSGERFYQSESTPKRTRYPANCFIFTKLLIDSALEPGLAATIKKQLLLEYIREDIKDPLLAEFTLESFPAESSRLTLIEVVAMIIKYAKGNAERQIKDVVKDVVITVPSYWNIRQRAFVVEAAQIADLHVLSLITENSAAAINYALNQRTKNTTETILFYNLGSNSLEMSLVEYRQVAEQKSKPVESIFVLADYSKTYVGGLKFDVLLHQHFVKKFQQKYKKPLNLRGQLKMWGEISEVKQTLSSNKDAPLYVEGIMDGIDYHDKITRVEFESMIEPNLKQITAPIKRFLFDNNLKPEDIDNVEVIGGSSRIPRLQSMVAEIIGDPSKVGTHINADEAMALGAAFYGANSSKKFKVKGANLYDGFNFQVRAVIRNLEDGISADDERYIFKNVTVFSKKSRFGLTKELNFKCRQDIIVELYKEDETGLELLRSDKIDSIKLVNESDFKVSITVAVDPLEVVSLKKAEIKYKKDEIQSYMEKVKKVKTRSEESTENDKNKEEQAQENKQVSEDHAQKEDQKQEDEIKSQYQQKDSKQNKEQQSTGQSEQKTKQSDNNSTKKKGDKKKKKQPKQQYETVQRNRTVTKKYQRDLHSEQIFSREKADHETLQKSRKMLKQYERAEQERKNLAESKNKLEALIYQIKQKSENQDFLKFAQKSQVQKLLELVAQKQAWYDETNTNNKHDYDQQSKILFKPLDRIKKRIHEYTIRDSHYKKATAAIQQYRDLSQNITKKKQWITQEQVDELIAKIDEFSEELEQIYQKMEATPENESCVYITKDMDKLVEKAKDEYFKVMAIQKPKKEKKQDKKDEKEADESEEL